jgi:CheY-like chemotaxis protein
MKPHLLLIDDDQDELRILSDSLEQAGIDCKCTWATCPLHALEILRYLSTDLIFIDYHMPKMNGIECIGKIREIPGCGEITIVLYSSELNDELVQAAYAAGAHHCVKKTDNSVLLTAALQNLFSATNEVEY